jgi:hypothetical protein
MILTAPETAASAQQGSTTSPKLVERVDFDWNHSGELTTFSLLGHPSREEPTGAYRLVVKRKDGRRWTFSNQGDVWIPVANRNLERQNLVPSSKRMLFISAGEGPATQIYLILIGAGSSCCVGSLDVLTAGSDGMPRVVFHSKEHLLAAVVPLTDQSGIELIGRSSDSEARALKNAQSYDPYRAYVITGAESAQYNLELSKAYTEAHYCEWHGPNYDERFVAIGKTEGAKQCRAMSEARFEQYRLQHPKEFPEP